MQIMIVLIICKARVLLISKKVQTIAFPTDYFEIKDPIYTGIFILLCKTFDDILRTHISKGFCKEGHHHYFFPANSGET